MLPDGGLSSSVRHLGPAPAVDKEPLLGGTVSLIPLEGRGFSVDLPEIYRRLRKLLGGGTV